MTTDPLDWLFGLAQFGIKFGLHNIHAIVEALDHPERRFRSVHIAGTNGKGSVTAIVDAALVGAGFRTGRYTSPHLLAASAVAAATQSSPSLTTSQIMPQSLAWAALNLSPVNAKPIARARPKRCGKNQLPPASGISPILLKA